MSDIPPINEAGLPAKTLPARGPSKAAGPVSSVQQPEDKVEISATGQLLSSLEGQEGFRAEKVAQVRQAILDGSYETDDKIEIAAERLLTVLRSVSAV